MTERDKIIDKIKKCLALSAAATSTKPLPRCGRLAS